MRLFAKEAGELLKSTDVLESHFIMLVLSQVIFLTFEASFSCKRFKLQVQLTLKQFCLKIKFDTRLCFCLNVCWHGSQPARTITETQKSMSSKEMSDSGNTRDMVVIPQRAC